MKSLATRDAWTMELSGKVYRSERLFLYLGDITETTREIKESTHAHAHKANYTLVNTMNSETPGPQSCNYVSFTISHDLMPAYKVWFTDHAIWRHLTCHAQRKCCLTRQNFLFNVGKISSFFRAFERDRFHPSVYDRASHQRVPSVLKALASSRCTLLRIWTCLHFSISWVILLVRSYRQIQLICLSH